MIKIVYKDNLQIRVLKDTMNRLKNAEWIGEDGDMVCNCKTELGAYRKFRGLMRDAEPEAAIEMDIENVGIGFLHFATDEDRKKMGGDFDGDWYVSYTVESDYPLFCYMN